MQGTDHDHLSSVPHVLLIDEAAVMRLYIHVIDRGMIRIYAIGLSRHIFLVVSDRVIVGDRSRAKIHLLEVSLQGAWILFLETDAAVGLHTFPRLGGIACPYLDPVGRHIPEVVHDAIAQPVSRPSNTINMKIPHETEKPVKKVRAYSF